MGPILDLAIHGDVIASTDGDGFVRTWRLAKEKLVVAATFHEDSQKPITALAVSPTGFVGAGTTLYSWDTEGNELAKASLPDVASNVVVRGETVYVLAGGELLSFSLAKLEAKKTWKHAAGVACELDVSDDEKRAIVIRDRKLVEIIDLVKNESLADWTRKGKKVDYASVRFNAKGETICAQDGDIPLSRVKDTTGRITKEIYRLESFSNGPIALDPKRRFAAIGGHGENVELVELLGENGEPTVRTTFFLDPRITDASEKTLAGMKRIPTFKEIAPGFFARHGSVKAPPTEKTLSAMAVNEGGRLLAAGFVSGELVVADVESGAVISASRGMLSEGRQRVRIPKADLLGTALDGKDLWVLGRDRHVTIFDLATHERREGPTLERVDSADERFTLVLTKDAIVALEWKRVIAWSRDGKLIADRELPEHKGARLIGDSLLVLPVSSLGHEGFDIVSFDVATGATKTVCHFDRDATRFPLGNQPTEWVRFGAEGHTPTLTIWAGKGATVAQTYAFDVKTGTLLREVETYASPHGDFFAKPDFSNPLRPGDAVVITRASTGEVILRCPYEPGDGPKTVTAAYDPETGYVAALVGWPRVAVWRPNARRLVLDGHRSATSLLLKANSLVVSEFQGNLRIWDVSGD